MIRASRLKLPPAERPVPGVAPWVFIALVIVGTAICWWLHIIVAALVFSVFTALIVAALIAASFERRRQLAGAAKLPRDASCIYARSFDFRQTDTLVMRAVYEELQPIVGFPIQASHRLSADLRLDEEDLNLDIAPIIAQRLHRTLNESEKNPYYGRVHTVEDLVHFMQAQPIEEAQQT